MEWIDITDNKSAELETQKNDKTLLRRLHIKDGEKVIGGAEAFLLVWKKIPKYKFLYTLFKIPIIFTLFSYFYEIIAFFLYLKNKKQLSK
jgi:predicted DCC family thiol-disulfide oxidoreductase YuxK